MNLEISPQDYERELNWHDANLYCELLVIDNKNDWRLPSIEELYDMYTGNIDLGFKFPHHQLSCFYWVGMEPYGNMTNSVDVISGYRLMKNVKELLKVRPVRYIFNHLDHYYKNG